MPPHRLSPSLRAARAFAGLSLAAGLLFGCQDPVQPATGTATTTGASSSSASSPSTSTSPTTTSASTGPETSGSLCPAGEVYACRADPEGACGPESGCVTVDGCDPQTCLDQEFSIDPPSVCDERCGQWWDCAPGESSQTVQCEWNNARCSVIDGECPEGYKCNPWATHGGSWDDLRCAPIAADPAKIGEPCDYAGEDPSTGLDNCEAGAVCWLGVCAAVCDYAGDSPECAAGQHCHVDGDGLLPLCLVNCDPLGDDCLGETLCAFNGARFECLDDASGDGAYGDPCEFANECAPGLGCMEKEFVEDCASYCCSPYCDINLPDTCPGETGACIPWYQDSPPPGYEHLGICRVQP